MNEYDSERVAGLLKERAWELTERESDADLILVNTCAIREKAEEKVFSKLGQLRALKARKPELIVGRHGLHGPAPPARDPREGAGRRSRVRLAGHRQGRRPGGRGAARERRPVLETGEAPLVKITAKPDGRVPPEVAT